MAVSPLLLSSAEQLLKHVLAFDHPADMLVSRYFQENRRLGARDRTIIADTIYSVLRNKARFEYFVQSAPCTVERGMAILGCQADIQWLQNALTEQEFVWYQLCQNINVATLPEALQHNLPPWLAQCLKQQLEFDMTQSERPQANSAGTAFSLLVQSLNQPAPLDLRVNTLKTKREQVQKRLADDGIETELTPFSPIGLRVNGKPALNKHPMFLDGSFEVQDEGSQLLALLLAPRRGEAVVDFCAGAGGKTLALGVVMRNTGRLYAWDISAHRLDALKPRLMRSGLSNTHLMAIQHEHDERIKRLYGKIDRVLIDAPCSGLGTLRRHPDLKWRQTPERIKEIIRIQKNILESACQLLKPGGCLIYATCSILRDENEDIAEYFSQAYPGFESLDVEKILNKQGVKEVSCLTKGKYVRLWPHLHQTDGFFAAAWQKK